MIRVVWLCPYNVNNLLPEIELNRLTISHNASWIQNLSNSLALKADIELHIITHSPVISKTQLIKKNSIHFHIIKYNFPFTNRGFPWYFPIDKLTGYYHFNKAAKKIILNVKPNILHVHGTEGGYYGPVSNCNIPYIVSIQGIIGELIKVELSLGGILQLPFEYYAIKNSKYFGCRTSFDYNYIKNRNKNAVIFDLPEAINKAFFEALWIPKVELSLLFVGSIIKRKGIEDLIYALVRLKTTFKSIQLKVIGSGTSRYVQHVKKIIIKNDLESNVTLLGTKSPSEIASELAKTSFFVLPSLVENSPDSLAEAMAVGVPCIATKIGGIPSMIQDNLDGMLFEKHDIDELINKITLLANNKELQIKLSTNARKKAFERHSSEQVTQKYVEVYKLLLK